MYLSAGRYTTIMDAYQQITICDLPVSAFLVKLLVTLSLVILLGLGLDDVLCGHNYLFPTLFYYISNLITYNMPNTKDALLSVNQF